MAWKSDRQTELFLHIKYLKLINIFEYHAIQQSLRNTAHLRNKIPPHVKWLYRKSFSFQYIKIHNLLLEFQSTTDLIYTNKDSIINPFKYHLCYHYKPKPLNGELSETRRLIHETLQAKTFHFYFTIYACNKT